MSRLVLQWDSFRESMLMALAAIRGSKLRSVLTLLGVAVGVFSIISVMTALGVLRNSIEDGITQLGANTFQIQKYPASFGDDRRGRFRNRKDITYEQAVQVKEKATLAEEVGIEGWQFGRVVFSQGQKTNPNVQVCGENPEGVITNDWVIESGRSFSDADMDQARMVAVLGKPVVEKLFPPYVDPVGQSIRVDGAIYQVIGVFQKKGGALGGNQDNFVCTPITTFFGRYGKEGRDIHIMVKARSREVVDDAVEQSRMILRAARHVAPGAEDDFGWFSNDSLIKEFNDLTLYLRLGVLLISSISLIAAGVGIMNIMLVSVTERTREIGIRLAIGAMASEVLLQFLVEAVTLSCIGGFLGILLALGLCVVLAHIIQVPFNFNIQINGIAFAFSAVVGVLFGFAPARRAARLNPIDALRHE